MAQTPQPPQRTGRHAPASPFTGDWPTSAGSSRRPTATRRDTNAIATRATGCIRASRCNRETAVISVRRERLAHRLSRSAIRRQLSPAEGELRLRLDLAAAQLQLPDADAVRHRRQHADARRQRAARGAGADQRHQRRHGRRRAVRAWRAAGGLRHAGAGGAGEGRLASIYNSLATPFDLRQQREHGGVRV